MEEIKEKIERWKIKADILIKENKKAFLKDINETYFWCYLIKFDDFRITFKPFKGNGEGIVLKKYWSDIIKFDEYEEIFK